MRRVVGIRRTKRGTIVFSEVPDDTLTEWALDADVGALAELHRRYAAIAARFAAVVSGRPEEASGMAAAAFSTTLEELAEDRLAIADAFLPRLLRCARAIALTGADHGVDARQLASSVPAGTNPVLLAEVFSGLSEPERSALWLSQVARLSIDDASIALAVSGGTSALRWTRPRSSGIEALVARADATLGDHRAGAVEALAGVDALLDAHHVDTVVAEWPKRAKRTQRWARPPLQWTGMAGQREPSAGRIVRFAVILVLVVAALGFLFGRHDTGTAQTSEIAKHLHVIGAPAGEASPSTPGGAQQERIPHAGAASPKTGQGSSSGSTQRPGSGPSEEPGPTSQGERPGTNRPAAASARIGISAASGTTVGVGTSSTTSTVQGGGSAPPTDGGSSPTTTAPPPQGSGPGVQPTAPPPTTPRPPTDSPTTTAPAHVTPTTTTTPPVTEPPTTEPTTTEPPTTEPPVTEPTTAAPPVTDPPTTEPPTTEPPVTEPPTTLPPVP